MRSRYLILLNSKANRIEIYEQTANGLVLSYTKAIYGKITMLERLQPANSPTEHLFVGTDRFTYFAVSWDAQIQQLRTEKSYIDQADTTFLASCSQRCLLDPTNRFIALHLFDGIVSIIPLGGQGKKKGFPYSALGDPTPVRISDILIRSSAFLYPRKGKDERPRIAVLFEDNRQMVCLNIRRLEYTLGLNGESPNAELEYITTSLTNLASSASHLIPVPGPACTYARKETSSEN